MNSNDSSDQVESGEPNYVILVSGPKGVGKTDITNEVVRQLAAQDQSAARQMKRTTRERRSWEVDGIDYEFMTDTDFKASVSRGDTVLTYTHEGHRYGYAKDFLDNLHAGKHVVVEAGIEALAALEDYQRNQQLDHRLIPILVHNDARQAFARLIGRQGDTVALSQDDVRAEYEFYKSRRADYRHLIENPDQRYMTREEFTSHLARRITDMIKEERKQRDILPPEDMRERYVEEVLSRLFEIGDIGEILELSNSGRLKIRFDDRVIDGYAARTNSSTRDLKRKTEKQVTAISHYGTLALFYPHSEDIRDTMLHLAQMQIGYTPQYVFGSSDFYDRSPMSYARADGQINFGLSFSMYDPMELPLRGNRTHTVTLESVLTSNKKPRVETLGRSEVMEAWAERVKVTGFCVPGYLEH